MARMCELINKQDIIQELKSYIVDPENAISEYPDDVLHYNDGLLTAIDVIIKLKAVPLKQEKVEWLVYYDEDCPQDGIFKCPICGQIISVDTPIPLNYCPNCGSDMKGEGND